MACRTDDDTSLILLVGIGRASLGSSFNRDIIFDFLAGSGCLTGGIKADC